MPDSDVTPHYPSDFYSDLLWRLESAAKEMALEAPRLASYASNRELSEAVYALLVMAREHQDAVGRMVGRLDRPARLRPAAFEALVGEAEPRLARQPPGDARDLEISLVGRAALHICIAVYDMCVALAGPLGRESERRDLSRMRAELLAVDERLHRAGDQVVRMHFPAASAERERAAPTETQAHL